MTAEEKLKTTHSLLEDVLVYLREFPITYSGLWYMGFEKRLKDVGITKQTIKRKYQKQIDPLISGKDLTIDLSEWAK